MHVHHLHPDDAVHTFYSNLVGGVNLYSLHLLHLMAGIRKDLGLVYKAKSGLLSLIRSPSQYYPNGRAGHSTVVIKDSLFLWGGYQEQIPSIHDSTEKRRITSIIDIFNLHSGQWSQKPTKGSPPLGVSGYACTPIDEQIYFFGGDCGHDNCYHNNVSLLDTLTLHWSEVFPTAVKEDEGIPTRKAACGIIHIIYNGEDALFVFGGYGICPSNPKPHTDYAVDSTNGLFRNNEQHIFIIKSGRWVNPDSTGQKPPPLNTLTMTKISYNKAVVFGGRINNEVTSDIYISTINDTIVEWVKLSDPLTLVDWPVGRRSHSSCCFSTGDQSYVLVMGGEDEDNDHINDCWILSTRDWIWKKVSLPDENIALRSFHAISSFYIGPNCMWLVITGGLIKDFICGPASALTIAITHSDKGDWVAEVILQGDESTSHYRERLTEQLMKVRTDFATEMLRRQNSSPKLSVGTQTLENSSISTENISINASNQLDDPVDTATQSTQSCDCVCIITDQINMPAHADQHEVSSNSEIIRQIRFSLQNDIQKKLEEAKIG
ncbi:PREDICTED: F-box/kelch-repeat protein At1g51550-like [Amphimedon queenslandica]|uniref:Uncharacterized protein n=1 Tax=Amphimedon queenslandica TaxID=400682 RepID=A0AAN0JST0_AMPQE|nr:PREDICTED: F-box/kelch-repeat protein At1g51550-like [Amphimedon queenslandica]|eukprot:XP_019860176.1 PREDICTED: F-box/kelch-repeat protein At1g51550-like [Amphimedon queenslandica]